MSENSELKQDFYLFIVQNIVILDYLFHIRTISFNTCIILFCLGM